jgi:hypothetical protein
MIMFHLFGFTESQDSAVLVPVTALADPSMTVSGDNVQIPDYASLLIGYAGIGVNITRAQLQSPSLRRTVNPEIRPLIVATEPNSPPGLIMFPDAPITLDAGEQIQAYVAEDAAGAAQSTVLVWLADGAITPVQGEIFSIRVTNASTLVVYTWTNGALTFDQVLPVGTYAIVGARFESAGLLAFRFLFQGSTPRPGGLGVDAASDLEYWGQRNGMWGVWGEFDSRTPPTVDFLSLSADTSQVGTLDLVRVG